MSTLFAAVAHGGAGGKNSDSDGALAAVAAALAKLRGGASALDAATVGAVVLEDDPRFNAGTGSNVRADGETAQMDAAVMTSGGLSGAVANLVRVRNPVLVAREVQRLTPYLLLAGQGALDFARRCGFVDYDPVTADAKARWAADHKASEGKTSDTIGIVVRRAAGDFAVAVSTGGIENALLGRIGDTPLIGCGLYAGPGGAVAATGFGEEIVRRFAAKTVYDWLVAGVPAQQACERGVALFPEAVDVGIIAVGNDSMGKASNRQMPAAAQGD